jgi:hypothetical protein
MTAWPALLILIAAAAPPVEVSMLNGDQHVGTLEKLAADEAVLKTPAGSNRLPAAELLSIRVPSVTTVPATVSLFEVLLTDSTLLRVTKYQTTTSEAMVTHPQLGDLKLPLATIQSVRFAPPDSKVDGTWKQLLTRSSKKDQVAVRKNDVLDHLDGVIGSVDETTIKFQLDGDDIPVKRERVFGLIYAKRDTIPGKTTASIDLATGDRLAARSVSWDGENWKVKLAAGTDFTVPATSIQYVDYTQGKIAYLSNMEPRDIKYTPFFDLSWDYRRDKCLDGRPISFGNKSYSKGLSLHSLTVLRYRSGGDYRRFQTVMGIDEHFSGNVDVTIKGDGRVLFKGSARAGQPPQNLDLDITGVVELEITVGFGEDELDIGDRLILADAKLVK